MLLPAVAPGVAPSARAASTTVPRPLPTGVGFDYQLGGPRDVPDGIGIVVRDRQAPPPAGAYSVCYVNAFQTQPGEGGVWRRRPSLVLRRRGRAVIDEAWNERLLDLRTDRRRRAIARIVARWTRRCAADGFDAVEFDNLDSYTRSHGLLRRRHATAFARLIVRDAHRVGLAVAQKNTPQIDGRRLGFDFVVAEECVRYRECHRYVARYGPRVLAVEYRARDLARGCRDRAVPTLLLRDRALRPDGTRRWCGAAATRRAPSGRRRAS